jgi:hypothetical protein
MIDKSSAFFGSLAKVYLVKQEEIERDKGTHTPPICKGWDQRGSK